MCSSGRQPAGRVSNRRHLLGAGCGDGGERDHTEGQHQGERDPPARARPPRPLHAHRRQVHPQEADAGQRGPQRSDRQLLAQEDQALTNSQGRVND